MKKTAVAVLMLTLLVAGALLSAFEVKASEEAEQTEFKANIAAKTVSSERRAVSRNEAVIGGYRNSIQRLQKDKEDQLSLLSALESDTKELKEELEFVGVEVQKLEVEMPTLETRKSDLEAELAARHTPKPNPPVQPVLDPPVQPAPAPITRGNGEVVTLSFDDSADASRVHAILDVLAQYGVKAVFCVTGNWAAGDPGGVISRMRAEGHLLCNHTASHAWLTKLSDEGIKNEILGGVNSYLLRPPYGAWDARVQSIAGELGYSVYLWSIDTRDWEGKSAQAIINEVLNNLHPGAVVLMHVHGANTLAALPIIIEGILAAGYKIG